MMKNPSQAGKTKSEAPDRIAELREQIADLKKRWPAHSTPPAMFQQLEELEEELENELKKINP